MKTKQEQIEEMCEAIASMICQIYNPQCDEYEPHTCSHCYANGTLIGDFAEMLYDTGYRKIPDDIRELIDLLADGANIKEKLDEIKRLEKENEQLKAKLEKNPLAIKQKIMEEDDYELTEREQATLFLDRMESDVEILNDIVENLDELLGKGIDEYIKGIDGVEGAKDIWERSAVRAFAEKVKAKSEMFLVAKGDGVYGEKPYVSIEKIDELLKEYE